MSEEKIELKVNVINQLKLFKQFTFKDQLCFVDEDVQNAQRAKATEVRISTDYYNRTVTIENDGKILTNPQALFSIAESEWDAETQKSENPFGMGFFSNITVSNYIEVFSGNKHIIFDVDKMINNNNTDIFIEEVEDEYKGFKLVLNNFKFNEVSSSSISERVMMLGKYIHELDVYYNDKLMDKKDLTEDDGSAFTLQLDNEKYIGWIGLISDYYFSSQLSIFYKGRLIKKLEGFPYVKGEIHITDKALNLVSPDRKDIINDDKFKAFKNDLKDSLKELSVESLINGEQQNIDDYAQAISYYTNKEEIKSIVKFTTFKSKESDDVKYLEGIALARKKNKEIKNFRDYELFLREGSEVQSESHFDEVEINTQLETSPKKALGIIYHEGSSSYTNSYTESPEIKESEIEERNANIIINTETPTFWMRFDEVEAQEKKLNIVRHYDLNIIIARNKIEEEILKSMKDTDNVLHISDLKEDVDVKGVLSNTELNRKEQRALMLLDMVSTILGFDHNMFAIGDLMVTKTVVIESINEQKETIEENIIVLRDTVANKIYFDRTAINNSKLGEDLTIGINLNDYKFILANLPLMAEALSILRGVDKLKTINKVLDILGNSN